MLDRPPFTSTTPITRSQPYNPCDHHSYIDMDFGGPASDFHMRLARTLKGVGMDSAMSFLLVGVLINTIALITANSRFALDSRTIDDVLALQEEIALLCLFYDIKVAFRFESLKAVPPEMIQDCRALGLDRSVLSRKRVSSAKALTNAQTLFNFLALARYLRDDFGPSEVALLVTDFNRKNLVYLPEYTIRRPGVGRRIGENPFRPGARPGSSGIWSDSDKTEETVVVPRPMADVSNIKAQTKSRFNPFKPKSKSKQSPTSKSASSRMVLDDENAPPALSEAPLRMRRKSPFALRRF